MAMRKEITESPLRFSRSVADRKEQDKLQLRQSNNLNNRKRPEAHRRVVSGVHKVRPEQKNDKVASGAASDQSEGTAEKVDEEKTLEEFKEIDISDEAPNCDQSIGTDNETVDTEESGLDDVKLSPFQKIEEMEIRIEKLEVELREVAALEISLYSVVPEHGSSAHKVHTPARRLSRLFIYACKHWSQDKRAAVARNISSGFVTVMKSCGNDIARLTFWLSNVIVLREIISQALGSSFASNSVDKNGISHKFEDGTAQHQRYSSFPGNKLLSPDLGSFKGVEDWQEPSTFRLALQKIESWIFARVVESLWWQTFTPHMQCPIEDTYKDKGFQKLVEPVLSDQSQGFLSINLWTDAFVDASTRLCPVRAGGNECGCLPVLTRMIMKQCVTRLDVAMFNGILRESASQIPTDPVSDPIVDARILPIPAGDLSFGSGAQLKNAIGRWCRSLSELFSIGTDDTEKDDQACEENNGVHRDHDTESKSFLFLNSLSDLLMLPKDLLNNSVRKEICPHISLPLVLRILCNFTPDDFCPDPVPWTVLEDLNSENLQERQISGNKPTVNFPYSAPPLFYCPPSAADVAQKVGDIRTKLELERNASIVQSRGYTSDEDLDDLDSPLGSILDGAEPVSPANGNGSPKEGVHANMRFKLLRQVWSS